ncbi:MAG: archease [Candidatus Aminicenantales bacterium]
MEFQAADDRNHPILLTPGKMNGNFRYLDHTADAKFQAFGRTLEEAFSNAALATASLMWDVESVEKRTQRKVQVRGRDLEQLLLHFLEEVIYAFETESFHLAAVEGTKIEEDEDGAYRLEAFFLGDDRPSGYPLHGEVKAITYNEMKIQRNDPITVQVVVDI